MLVESIIDDLLYREKRGIPAARVKTWKMLPGVLAAEIEEFYEGVLPSIYHFKAYRLRDINQSLMDMLWAQRILYDPQGIKAGFNKGLEFFSGKRPLLGKPF